MNAPRTIPRATVIAALETLGVDIPLADSFEIHLTGNSVIFTTWPNFEILGWRIVDECPSCHTADDHPHTDYCQAAAQDGEVGAEPASAEGSHSAGPADGLLEESPVWVDDGCRCPSRDNHRPGCPVLEPQPDPDFEDPGISENGK